MKSKTKYVLYILCGILFTLASCNEEDFIELNTNPETLYTIAPENQFLNATLQSHSNDFEWYYDNYRRIMPWMQMNTAPAGNGQTFIEEAGNVNARYGTFYGMGSKLIDLQKLADKLPAEDQIKYKNWKAIADVLLVNYAFYTTDVNGYIPFSEAFQARYGGTVKPKYDTQQELYDNFDTKLKAAITTMKSSGEAILYKKEYDLYYTGNVQNWIKAANALRLKVAMRLMKRDPAKMKAIALEVLSSPASDLMSSNSDSWIFKAKNNYTNAGGNWNVQGFKAPRPTVNFMNTYSDPRIRNFYQKNKSLNYVGSYTSPDEAAKPANQVLYDNAVRGYSNLQYRLFTADFNGGTGINYFPVITYADFALMRAELAARSISAENPATWYNAGVTASILMYDEWANGAKIIEQDASNDWVNAYVPVTATEISDYLAKPGIAYDPAKGIEQICIQEYINLYKQPNEAWSLFKRTGYPNTTSALAFETFVAGGTVQKLPRRVALSYLAPTDENYANNKAALDAQLADPSFGNAVSDYFGRIWWDKN